MKKPSVLLILADDVGWFDVGAYNRGIMGGPTPNIDRIAREGILLTDCYAQANCTAGRNPGEMLKHAMSAAANGV